MKKLILIIALALAGCTGTPSEQQAVKAYQANLMLSNISYIKDTRTDLCFAVGEYGMPHGGPIFTQVPCSAVKDFVK